MFKEIARPVEVLLATADEYPPRLQSISERNPDRYRRYNPDPEVLLGEMVGVADKHNAHLTSLKGDHGVRKRDCLEYCIAFTDSHNVPINRELVQEDTCLQVIEEVEKRFAESRCPMDVPDQLDVSLKFSEGDIYSAVASLAVSSRLMARAYDTRLVPLIEIDEDRLINWKKCIAPFGYQDNIDTVGDNYHFWHGVLAGMSIEEGVEGGLYDRCSAAICNAAYQKVAPATEWFRYRICGRSGKSHGTIDNLGLEIGRAFYSFYSGKDSFGK